MRNLKSTIVCLAMAAASGVSAGTAVQFGGSKDSLTNANWQSQIGADEVVQWNGVNSFGGSFGASGNLNNAGVGATLSSSNSAVTLTTVTISSTLPEGTNTFATGNPNLLGVKGGDNAKFDVANDEAWTFTLNQNVTLKNVIVSGVDGNLDMPTIDVAGVTNFAMTSGASESSAVTWEPTNKRFVWTFADGGLSVSAGTEITLSAVTGGAWGLQGVVLEIDDPPPMTLVQFGGGAGNVSNANYQTQIGADQIIQWNGVNSWGGAFGANGSVASKGVNATLWSSNNTVTLTSRIISSTDAAGTNTFATGNPNILGVLGGDNGKFDVVNSEAWTFDFNKDVSLKHVIVSAVDGNLDMPTITVDGITSFAMTRDATESAAVTWDPVTKRYVWTFSGAGLNVPAGTNITLQAVGGGGWGLQGIVIGYEDQLSTPASLYDDWLAAYPTIGSSTNLTDNPDGDSVNNLEEYALGGDPTDPNKQGRLPAYRTSEAGGTNFFDYVHSEREDASARGLVYEVQLTDDLTADTWTNTGYTVIDGPVNGGFRTVTNRVSTDVKTAQFFRLNIDLD